MKKLIMFILFFTLLLPVSVYAQSLVGYWKFDEGSGNTAVDSAGNNDGVIYGATWSDNCISGSCLTFDGVDDYVDCGKDESIAGNFSEITITAWFKTNEKSSRNQWIVGDMDSIAGYRLRVHSDSVKALLRYNHDLLSPMVQYAPVAYGIADGDWHKVAMTYSKDSQEIKLYLDSVEVDSKPWNLTVVESGYGTYIGKLPNFLGFFNGSIDEVKIYNRVLDEDEIFNKNPLERLIYLTFGRRYDKITPDHLATLENSSYDAFASFLQNAYTSTSMPPKEKFDNYTRLVKQSKKEVWPWIFMNRMVGWYDVGTYKDCGGYCKDSDSNCDNFTYFSQIKIMDIFDEVGALTEFYHLLNISLEIAKETNTPGIVIDHECYNNYCAGHVRWIAGAQGISENQTKTRLREIGAEMADMINAAYPDATILFLTIIFDESYMINHVALGMLERAKQMGYSFKVVEGGEALPLSGYISCSLGHLMSKSEDRLIQYENLLEEYPNLVLGGTISPFYDYEETKGWVRDRLDNCGPKLKVWTIQDHLPLLKYLFSTNEYVWVYGAGAAPYNLFEPEHFTKYEPTIGRALIETVGCNSNGICETGETVDSCPDDCNPADINTDGEVDIQDLIIITSHFGLNDFDPGWNAAADVIADGQIDVYDLVFVASRFT